LGVAHHKEIIPTNDDFCNFFVSFIDIFACSACNIFREEFVSLEKTHLLEGFEDHSRFIFDGGDDEDGHLLVCAKSGKFGFYGT